MKQTAFKFNFKEKKVDKVQVDVPQVGSREVVLKVLGSGLCRSDVYVRDGHLKLHNDHFIGGHEIAGKVVQVGSDVQLVKVGERFAVYSGNPCYECGPCKRSFYNCCEQYQYQTFGLAVDGGWQQYFKTNNLKTLVPIPENVTYEAAAVTTDSVLTPYHAIKRANLTPSSKVLLIGAGGLGINAIQIVKAFNSYLVVTDVKESLKQTVLKYGADEFHTDLRKTAHKPSSFDVVIDMCGFKDTYRTGIKYVMARGIILAVGLGYGKVDLNLAAICNKEVSLLGNFYGTIEELKECFDLVAKGLVVPDVSLVPFDDVNSVITDLRSGKIKGRAAFNPNAKL